MKDDGIIVSVELDFCLAARRRYQISPDGNRFRIDTSRRTCSGESGFHGANSNLVNLKQQTAVSAVLAAIATNGRTGVLATLHAVVGAGGITRVLTRSDTVPVTGVRLLCIALTGIAAGSSACRLACLAARRSTGILTNTCTGAVGTSGVLFYPGRSHTKLGAGTGTGVLALTLTVVTTAT